MPALVSVHLPEHPAAFVGSCGSFDGATSSAICDSSPGVRTICTPPLMCLRNEPQQQEGRWWCAKPPQWRRASVWANNVSLQCSCTVLELESRQLPKRRSQCQVKDVERLLTGHISDYRIRGHAKVIRQECWRLFAKYHPFRLQAPPQMRALQLRHPCVLCSELSPAPKSPLTIVHCPPEDVSVCWLSVRSWASLSLVLEKIVGLVMQNFWFRLCFDFFLKSRFWSPS